MRKLNKTVVCKDGFSMSVQANEGAYCSPKVTGAERYNSCEVGYPSQNEELILEWAEEPESAPNTIYGYVPTERISLVIAKHGGMVSGEVPPGVPELRA